MFVRVAVNIPAIDGVFDYAVPESLAPNLQIGCLITAPFGAQIVQGVILELTESCSIQDPKSIIDLLDPAPVLTLPQIALAIHIADSTLNSLASIVGLMLPAGLSQRADVLYALNVNKSMTSQDGPPSVSSARLIKLLAERGPLRGRQIDLHFARVDWRKTAQFLIKKGLLSSKQVLPPPKVRPKFIRVAQLSVAPQEANEAMPTLGTKQTLARRQTALKFLIEQPDAINVAWVYAESGCKLADLQELEERGLIRLFENEIFRDPLENTGRQVQREKVSRIIELTPEQSSAYQNISSAISSHLKERLFLLQGVTGSGKTEIYLRATDETIKRGKQVIMLVPEIALTAQIVRSFLARFPGQVGLVHSRLSDGERYDTWRRARAGKLKVIIGARSALFTPFPNIGLIVLDECHDGSYYQSEPPFYHAVTVAQEYSRLNGSICLLGSATPTVEQRYKAESGQIKKLDLPQRIVESGLPPVEVVDMREELKAGNREIFSRALTESLAETISLGEQAILFLNHRGTATYVFCRDCGTAVKCPRCETPLTLHTEILKSANVLTCHRCGYERQVPKKCDVCGSTQIRAYGLGSEKVEAEVRALFPQARTLRWDWDTTRRKDAHEMILTHFVNHQADVLVGTQMLAKGLDLPLVTLVGIVLAEVGLNLPDPFANEKVFQTLTQVAGRAGRSARGGKVILQTFSPEHYAIQFASKHDVNGFYLHELAYRKQLGYPPFARLARLEYRHSDILKAEEECIRLADKLKVRIESEGRHQTELIGPVPSFFTKENGQYRWQIVLRGPDPISLLRDIKLNGWLIEIDPLSLL
jgi:primosomal protein N' (replication factor Y)